MPSGHDHEPTAQNPQRRTSKLRTVRRWNSFPAPGLPGRVPCLPRRFAAHRFEPATPKGFRRPSLRIPKPAFMVKLLPAFRPWMIGTLVYADRFGVTIASACEITPTDTGP